MEEVVLERLSKSEAGCFGRILAPRGFACFSGELPDRGNAPGISCVPTGIYDVVWAMSPRLRRNTYRLLAVPCRSGILKHPANFMGDAALGLRCQLNGCIALGEKVGVMDGQRALLISGPAVRRFEAHMDRQPFRLRIIDHA